MKFGLTDEEISDRSDRFTDISGREADGSATYRRAGEEPARFPSVDVSDPRNVRIAVIDLIIAARALHEFRVVAAGHSFATLELTARQRFDLTCAHVAWTLD